MASGRLFLAVVLLVGVLACGGPAQSSDERRRIDESWKAGVSPCDGHPLRWTRAKALQEVAWARAEYGFRHDRAYLTRRARRVRRHGRTTWKVPYTRAERRYLRARERLWRLVSAVDGYGRRRAAVYGGVGIREAWPYPAFVEARFTRDVEAHVTEIEARTGAGSAIRGRQVTRSARDLEHLAARVEADRGSLRSEQLHVLLVEPDFEANVVRVDLWTPRADAAPALTARYGDGTRAQVLSDRPEQEACHDVIAYRPSPSERVLRVQWGGSGMLRLARIQVRETARRVLIGVVVHQPVGPLTADLRYHNERVRLRQPLGRRNVIDAATGRRLNPRDWRPTGPFRLSPPSR